MTKQPKLIAWGMLVGALALAALTLLVPYPASQVNSVGLFHFNIYMSGSTTLMQIMAAVLFFWGLRSFKTQLKIAVSLISVAVILLGVAQIQAPIISSLDLWDTIWVRGGIVIIPYVAPLFLLFFGMRRFAQLLEIKTIWTSAWLVFGITVAGGVVAALLPHAPIVSTEIEFRASMAVATASAVFLITATILAFQVRKFAGAVYKDALLWLTLAIGADAIAGLNYLFINFVFGDKSPLIDHGGTSFPFWIGAFLFMRAGYAFLAINLATKTQRDTSEPVTLIDIVIATAGEASNPQLIDNIMEPVRGVTATLTPDGVLNDDQVRELNVVYGELEDYLVNNEPVRKFTAQQVRQTIMDKLGIDQSAVPLWKLPIQQ